MYFHVKQYLETLLQPCLIISPVFLLLMYLFCAISLCNKKNMLERDLWKFNKENLILAYFDKN